MPLYKYVRIINIPCSTSLQISLTLYSKSLFSLIGLTGFIPGDDSEIWIPPVILLTDGKERDYGELYSMFQASGLEVANISKMQISLF